MSLNYNNHYRFFYLQIIRYNLFTKKYSAHYRDPNNLCTFCNNEPEDLIHLLFYCPQVQNLITTVKNNVSQLYDFQRDYMNNPQKFLLGIGLRSCDDKTFVLNINIARFTWIAKHDGRALTLQNFKSFFNAFVKIQKIAGVLKAVRDVDINSIWI